MVMNWLMCCGGRVLFLLWDGWGFCLRRLLSIVVVLLMIRGWIILSFMVWICILRRGGCIIMLLVCCGGRLRCMRCCWCGIWMGSSCWRFMGFWWGWWCLGILGWGVLSGCIKLGLFIGWVWCWCSVRSICIMCCRLGSRMWGIVMGFLFRICWLVWWLLCWKIWIILCMRGGLGWWGGFILGEGIGWWGWKLVEMGGVFGMRFWWRICLLSFFMFGGYGGLICWLMWRGGWRCVWGVGIMWWICSLFLLGVFGK